MKDVLSRAYLRERYEQITDEMVDDLILLPTYRGRFIRHVREHFTYPRDPKDEPYLNLSIEAQADYLIGLDNNLLDLMHWDKTDGREFQKRFRFLNIVTPKEFLHTMTLASQ